MNFFPPDNFRESMWNRMQHLDSEYLFAKAKMLGIDHAAAKDPLLRWDLCEPQDGQFDFGRLDAAIERAKKYDLKLKLYLPTFAGFVPGWWRSQRPESVIRTERGEVEARVDVGSAAHNFMGPIEPGEWHRYTTINLHDRPTRERFERFIEALAKHLDAAGHKQVILCISADLYFPHRWWRSDPADVRRAHVQRYYAIVGEILKKHLPDVLVDLEVSDGEAHHIDKDYTAHTWRSVGLAKSVDIPGVSSETPYFEDLMRAVGIEARQTRKAPTQPPPEGAEQMRGPHAGEEQIVGPFFYQNCEYGFGTMLSINFFTAMLRDGLWNDGWFGPEGILRWGYFPQVFAWNDRQLQWSGITNGWLAYRQAHALSATLANTRVTPADVILVQASAGLDEPGSTVNRELVGWGWALTALKIPYDVLFAETLERDGVPPRCRLLILPQASLSDRARAAVEAYVRGGGRVFVSILSDDPSGVAGVVSNTGVKGTWWQTTVNRGLHSGRYTPIPPIDQGYPRRRDGRRIGHDEPYQILRPAEGDEVVDTWLDGSPAILERAAGEGKMLISGYPFGNELVFADWTSIAFGKIYNGWARDEQMLGMRRQLQVYFDRLDYRSGISVPKGWRYRLKGFEAAVSSLSFPQGPELDDPFTRMLTYLDPRPGRAIPLDEDDLDYAAELTWRDRPGLSTRYLCVANRESAYAGERASVQFWMMPHTLEIHIDDPQVQSVYDVAAGAPVRIEKTDRGVKFRTTVPPAMGRIYAVSTSDTVELFEPAAQRGIGFDEIAADLSAAAGKAEAAPEALVFDRAGIIEWLKSKNQEKLAITIGEDAYRPAAEALAEWIKRETGLEASIVEDGTWTWDPSSLALAFVPSAAQIHIGSAWSNDAIARIDANWPLNERTPPLPASRLTATRSWPGGERGVVLMTRRIEFRNEKQQSFTPSWNNHTGFAPRDIEESPEMHMRRAMLVLCSTPEGAMKTVQALAASE
jgi:hypothetical protein